MRPFVWLVGIYAIYMALDRFAAYILTQNSFPQFYSKNAPKKLVENA